VQQSGVLTVNYKLCVVCGGHCLYVFLSLSSLSVFLLFSVLLSVFFFCAVSDSWTLCWCDYSAAFSTNSSAFSLITLLSFSWCIAVFWSVLNLVLVSV